MDPLMKSKCPICSGLIPPNNENAYHFYCRPCDRCGADARGHRMIRVGYASSRPSDGIPYDCPCVDTLPPAELGERVTTAIVHHLAVCITPSELTEFVSTFRMHIDYPLCLLALHEAWDVDDDGGPYHFERDPNALALRSLLMKLQEEQLSKRT